MFPGSYYNGQKKSSLSFLAISHLFFYKSFIVFPFYSSSLLPPFVQVIFPEKKVCVFLKVIQTDKTFATVPSVSH